VDDLDMMDYRVFPDYIMPMLFDNYFENTESVTELEDEVIQYSIVKKLGDLVLIAEKFKFGKDLGCNYSDLKSLNNTSDYVQDFVFKIFTYIHQVQNPLLTLTLFKSLPKLYIGLGSKLFSKTLLPNLRDITLTSTGNLLFELWKTLAIFPLKSEEICSSIECFQKIESQWELTKLYPYINPIVLVLMVTEKMVVQGKEGAKESLVGKLFKSIRYKGMEQMAKAEYEPFFKEDVRRELYKIFKDKRSMLEMCKLETVKTIEVVYNMLSEKYRLQEGDIKKIKVGLAS
jgi:hypothetical protein